MLFPRSHALPQGCGCFDLRDKMSHTAPAYSPDSCAMPQGCGKRRRDSAGHTRAQWRVTMHTGAQRQRFAAGG